MLFQKKQFIIAYKWIFDCTTEKAEEQYNKAIQCADKDYITEVIDYFKENNPDSFWFI